MSLGLVVLEKKLFTRTRTWTRTRTPMPQSDDIMSADIKRRKEVHGMYETIDISQSNPLAKSLLASETKQVESSAQTIDTLLPNDPPNVKLSGTESWNYKGIKTNPITA